MSSALQELKSQLDIEGILVTDSKGFEIYNNGFTQSHHLHALKKLSSFFFPGQEGTVVGIQTDQFTVVIKETPEGNLVATKQIK